MSPTNEHTTVDGVSIDPSSIDQRAKIDPASMPLSVLDLAIVAKGTTSAQALGEATEMVKVADRLGYRRFWVAEHHNMSSVASTNPPVLMAHLAAHSERIRVGSGGVMLPNHAPLVVAEQFALLEALNPGRIDLGIGRAPGTDRNTAAALRRSVQGLDEDFPRHLLDVMGLLGDERVEEGLFKHFRATPVATSAPVVWLLGSSGFSAQLAGVLGLPFAFANHFDMGGTEQAAQIYLDHFEPSVVLDAPHLMVSATVVVGATPEEADYLAAPSKLRRFALRTGQPVELVGPDEAMAHPNFATATSMPSNSLVGTAETVVEGLRQLRARTAADELMLYPVAHALEHRVASLEGIAAQWSTT